MQVNPVDTALSWLIIILSVALIPAMLTWWLVAQHVNSRMRRAGTRLDRSRWHFLRFGPAAPLISAAAFLCGFLAFHVPQLHDALSPDVRFAFWGLAGFGLVASMMSIVLWAYSNAPSRGASDRE